MNSRNPPKQKEKKLPAERDIWSFLNHSRHYHDYFEGYAEKQIPASTGSKARIERVYVREYYKQDVTDSARVILRICYAVLFAAGAGIFFYTAVRSTEANMAYYVSVSFFLTMAGLFWTAVALVSWFSAPKEMTVWQYHSGSGRLPDAALVTGVTMIIDMAVTGLFIILNRDCNLKTNFISMTGFLLSALFIFTLFFIEKKITYIQIPNKNTRDSTSFIVEA